MNWFDEDRPKPEKTLTTGYSNYRYVPQVKYITKQSIWVYTK